MTPEHMATLTETNTNVTQPEHHRLQFGDEFDNSYDFPAQEGETVNSSDSESQLDSDKDLEKGDAKEDNIKAEKAKREEQQEKDPNLIEWDGPNDPENPMNWPATKKWRVTIAMGLMTLCVTFASSVFSNATMPVAELFGVSTEVTTLGTSLFVLGFAVGPMVSTP
jgi:DHA1 family multidrug resistance protein-like MFS transporter